MALKIDKAYVIKVMDYQTFDQIITFFNEFGYKFNLISIGSRRIASKNGRHLIVGNLNEVEYFPARIENKIGRMKKSVTITAIPWEFHDYLSFNLLNEFVYKETHPNKKLFNFYSNFINVMHEHKFSDYALLIRVLIFIIEFSGMSLSRIRCAFCLSNQPIFIDKNNFSWICELCYEKNANNLKAFSNKIVIITKDLIKHKRTDIKVNKIEAIEIISFLNESIYSAIGIWFETLKHFVKQNKIQITG